jgi:hypothetical protein
MIAKYSLKLLNHRQPQRLHRQALEPHILPPKPNKQNTAHTVEQKTVQTLYTVYGVEKSSKFHR